MKLYTNNVERLRITQDGKVGVNAFTVVAPFQVFDHFPVTVDRHDLSVSDVQRVLGFNAYVDNGITRRFTEGPAAKIAFDATEQHLQLAATDPGPAQSVANFPNGITLKSDGKVGVGTTKPDAFFHIYEDAPIACLRLNSAATSGKSSFEFWTGAMGSSNRWRPGFILSEPGTNFTGSLRFYTNGSGAADATGAYRAMELSESHAEIYPRLGVGTAAHAQDRLFVNGALRVSQAGQSYRTVRLGHNGTNGFLEVADPNASAPLVINGLTGRDTEFGGDVLIANHLGIGTASFVDGNREFHLSVEGHIRCKAARVYPSWSDYVFEADYDLMSLNSVAEYISANGHLPGIPSEREVRENGIDVGETQALLLEKIEDLTLHLIRLERKNQKLSNKIAALESGNG
ncbi:MAG: hypothetical protein AAF570_24100 [Bacteroidota bacterium]